MDDFEKKVAALRQHHEELLSRKNEPMEWGNGIYEKYKYPVAMPLSLRQQCRRRWQANPRGQAL